MYSRIYSTVLLVFAIKRRIADAYIFLSSNTRPFSSPLFIGEHIQRPIVSFPPLVLYTIFLPHALGDNFSTYLFLSFFPYTLYLVQTPWNTVYVCSFILVGTYSSLIELSWRNFDLDKFLFFLFLNRRFFYFSSILVVF